MGQKKYDLGNDIFPDESSDDRAYPFIHNPVVNHLKNETKIEKQNKGEPGYDKAQKEKGKDQQKVLAPLSKKMKDGRLLPHDLEAVRRECCCPNMQDGDFGGECPNIRNTSIEKYGICSPWRNSETGNECAWYFQQFCSYKKKKAYWVAIQKGLKTKLNDADKEAIREEMNRTRLDVKGEILEKYEKYCEDNNMPKPKKPEPEWVERMPFDDAATKLRKIIMNQAVMLEVQGELLDQMDSDNDEVKELRSLVEAWKNRAREAEDQAEIFKIGKMDINEEKLLEMDKELIKLNEEAGKLGEKLRHYNEQLMAHYRETKRKEEAINNNRKKLQKVCKDNLSSPVLKNEKDAIDFTPEPDNPTPRSPKLCNSDEQYKSRAGLQSKKLNFQNVELTPEKERLKGDKEQNLRDRESLRKKERSLCDKEQILRDKEQSLRDKEQSLRDKEQSLRDKDKEQSLQQERLTQREKRLNQLEENKVNKTIPEKEKEDFNSPFRGSQDLETPVVNEQVNQTIREEANEDFDSPLTQDVVKS
ncbi:unnamed protein product [Bathycoccus prasinos]